VEGYTDRYRFRSVADPALWWNTVKSDRTKYIMDEDSTPGDVFTFETYGNSYYVYDVSVEKYIKKDYKGNIKLDSKKS